MENVTLTHGEVAHQAFSKRFLDAENIKVLPFNHGKTCCFSEAKSIPAIRRKRVLVVGVYEHFDLIGVDIPRTCINCIATTSTITCACVNIYLFLPERNL